MNLVIDVGNYSVKLAIFNSGQIVYKETVDIGYVMGAVLLIKEKYGAIKSAILSCVGNLRGEDVQLLKSYFDLKVLDSNFKLPFNNLYETPNTLGADRMVLMSAAVYNYPKQNVLVIDAGSCITYDFVTANNDYLGGAISPGVRMRYKALKDYTARLPLLDTEAPKNIIGNSTATSIHSGIINGVVNEIDGAILSYKVKYPDLTVILTGGDANFLSKKLKSSIFANSNFLLEGLNQILLLNSN